MSEQKKAFHELLAQHLEKGTGPGQDISGGWQKAVFATRTGYGDRTVRAWLHGSRVPNEKSFDDIATTLFGDDPHLTGDREVLRLAWDRAKSRRGRPGRHPIVTATRAAAVTVARPERCFGRREDVAKLLVTLNGPGPVAVLVLGEGGMGKTTLARQVATEASLVARFGARRFEARLETAVSGATDLEARVAEAAGADPARGLEGTLPVLALGPTLLLLDNLETPWEADRAGVEATLRRLVDVPGVILMASLRGREAPRGLRWSARYRLGALANTEARRLFLDIAPNIREDDLHLPAFLADLAGIPLAIELVARRAEPRDSLVDLWAEWQTRGPAAAYDPRASGTERHASVARSIEFSLASTRLKKSGRLLFRLLGALPAGAAWEDREMLLGIDAGPAADQLLSVGLAYDCDGRLDLRPPVRRHALMAHSPGPSETAAWTKHYLELARTLGALVGSRGGAAAASRLKPEVENLEAAVRTKLAAGEPAAVVASLTGLQRIMRFTGLGRIETILAVAAACAVHGDVLCEANARHQAALVAFVRSNHVLARAEFRHALGGFQLVGDRLGEADCVWGIADIARDLLEHDRAIKGYAEALALYRNVTGEAGRIGEAHCVRGIAHISYHKKDFDAARAGFETASRMFNGCGEVLGEANCVQWLAEFTAGNGRFREAAAGFRRAMSMYEDIGSLRGVANCVRGLGHIALTNKDHERARRLFSEARELFLRVSALRGVALCIETLGGIAVTLGAFDDAKAEYTLARDVYRRIGDRCGEARALTGFSNVAGGRRR